MDYRKLGGSELLVSSVCLGTMTFGQQNSEAEAHAQLDLALEHGVNFIDAAEMYPVPARAETYGRTEEIVGTWLRGRPRDKIVVATKVAGPARSMDWIRGGPLALDNAISVEAAAIKQIVSPVAGRANILIVPDLEAGNMLAKSLSFLASADAAGIVLGARVPIVLTSRADSLSTGLAASSSTASPNAMPPHRLRWRRLRMRSDSAR